MKTLFFALILGLQISALANADDLVGETRVRIESNPQMRGVHLEITTTRKGNLSVTFGSGRGGNNNEFDVTKSVEGEYFKAKGARGQKLEVYGKDSEYFKLVMSKKNPKSFLEKEGYDVPGTFGTWSRHKQRVIRTDSFSCLDDDANILVLFENPRINMKVANCATLENDDANDEDDGSEDSESAE